MSFFSKGIDKPKICDTMKLISIHGWREIMKKFLIFLVAIITTVCIGVTFYQFAKNDEIIKFTTNTVYVNYGDKLSLEDLGYIRKEPSKSTKIDFNAGGDEVTSIIKYDELSGCYIPTAKGGSTTIKITTTNPKYKTIKIDVMVGIGTEEFPYYINNEEQLFDVCNTHIADNACFQLVQDITLTKPHSPIGLIEDEYHEFTGKFNGNNHTISNLKINSCDNAGLFAIIGANSEVYNLSIDNAIIEGEFINAGTIAGKCFGTINKVVVSNSTITNTKAQSNTGAIVGTLATVGTDSATAGILRTSAYTDNKKLITANGNLGGLAGYVNSATIHACLTNLNLTNTSNSYTGGLVGGMVVNQHSYIRESYSISTINAQGTTGNIAGIITLDSSTNINTITKELVLVGLYYDNTLNKFAGIGSDNYGFAKVTNFAVNGKSTVEMKVKNTYIYYVDSTNNIVYWDKVWSLTDGEYPSLTFTNNFDDIILEGETDNLPMNPDISNPEAPSASAIIISNKDELISIFQGVKTVYGNYILHSDIDLDGMNWIPVNFSGTFKSSTNENYTISNFKIVANDLYYAGFFNNVASATISNITFNNVQVTSTTANESAGVVVGNIRGNTLISNVDVINAKIDIATKYSGGIVGFINNIVKIEKCDVQNLTITNSANVGGIAGYTSANTYINSCKLSNANLNAYNRIGGIIAINYGIVNDSSFNGNIQSSSSNTGYFGGLCGVNYSQILNSSTFAEITTANTADSSNGVFHFIGGLSGYNLGKIISSSAYANKYSASQSTGVVYIGGLTAYNAGTLEYCVVNVTNIGSVHQTIYVAGLTVFNYGGNIFGCFAFGNLSGYQVAGLVRTNTNDGIIDSCLTGLDLSARATYKGVYVVSFAYDISSGTISNCSVNANLTGTNDDGWVAGFAGFMPCSNDKFGNISYSIANVSIQGLGVKYLDIAQDGLLKSKRTTGTITNTVISADANVEDVEVSKYSKILWFKQDAGSQSNYIVASAEDLINIDTYLNPNTCNFDIGVGLTDCKWLFVNEVIPMPTTVLEVFGYDIIGLG